MELWDAYDENFNKIEGMTLVRGEERSFPEGVYHLVCDVLVRHVDGTYLIMQRAPVKTYAGMWEATAGGSALKGETPFEGAVRELFEETGISSSDLTKVRREVSPAKHSVYFGYYHVTDCDKQSIKLQEGETSDFRWITKEEFLNLGEGELLTEWAKEFVRKDNF